MRMTCICTNADTEANVARPVLFRYVFAEDMNLIGMPKGWMFPQFASLKRVVNSQSGFVRENRLMLVSKSSFMKTSWWVVHTASLISCSQPQKLFGNLIDSILHIHSMFAYTCVTAAFKKEDKSTYTQSFPVWGVCCCLSSGAGLVAVWH